MNGGADDEAPPARRTGARIAAVLGRCGRAARARAHLSLLQWPGSPCQPSGRKTIAQHFSAGSASIANQVPSGTNETVRRLASVVPDGTFRFPGRQPSTEVLGYFRSSLRDCANAHRSLQETQMRPPRSCRAEFNCQPRPKPQYFALPKTLWKSKARQRW